MAITVNKNTTGAPMTQLGRTGQQLVRLIPAARVYMKSADPTDAAPVNSYFIASNGTTPDTWQDLGIVANGLKITYDKKVNKVVTELDQYLRSAYINSKNCTIEFELEQFDDVNLELLTGFTPTVGSGFVNFQLGQEDLVNKAILVVIQNKLDRKEFQFYNPNAYTNFEFNDGTNGMTLKVSCLLPSFTAIGRNDESFLSLTEFVIDSGTTPVTPPSGSTGTLLITDSVTGNNMAISVADGTLQFGAGSAGASPSSYVFTDSVTGLFYTLQVADGTLTAAQTSNGTGAVNSVTMIDTITSRNYAIGIASGTFTVTPL